MLSSISSCRQSIHVVCLQLRSNLEKTIPALGIGKHVHVGKGGSADYFYDSQGDSLRAQRVWHRLSCIELLCAGRTGAMFDDDNADLLTVRGHSTVFCGLTFPSFHPVKLCSPEATHDISRLDRSGNGDVSFAAFGPLQQGCDSCLWRCNLCAYSTLHFPSTRCLPHVHPLLCVSSSWPTACLLTWYPRRTWRLWSEQVAQPLSKH